jgi:hypothetical protein
VQESQLVDLEVSGIFTSSANVGRATKVKVARAVAQESATTCFLDICQ